MNHRIIKITAMALSVALLVCVACGCSEASKVNKNISKQADYFEVMSLFAP